MLWAAMPEAAVNEDGHLLTPKDDVRFTSQSLKRLLVDAIPQPAPMKLRAERKLRTGVALAVALHCRSDSGRRGRRRLRNDSGGPVAARSIGGSF